MRALFFAIMLVGGLTGCAGFGEYLATDPDGPGPQVSPMAQAGSDMAGSLSAFEEGGIIAGIVALVLTAGKTGLRLYSGWRAAKAAKEGATP